MTISRWFCTRSTKNMLVKIVHPGGHVELHDRPVLASEVMLRNPRCIVAHPQVFKQPWAIVPPDTTLMLGQKFYVVPTNTIRKLQRQAFKYSLSPTATTVTRDSKGDVPRLYGNCFACLITKLRINRGKGDDASVVTASSSSSFGSSETKGLTKKSYKEFAGESPMKFSTFDNWQPRLERIVEESSN